MRTYFIIIFIAFASFFLMSDTFPVSYSKDIDITKADRELIFNESDIKVNISMTRPAHPFKKIRFTFTFTKNGKAFHPDEASVKFNMKMDMGNYHSQLVKINDEYKAEGVLPKCMSGGKLWYGKIMIKTGNKNFSRIFLLELQ